MNKILTSIFLLAFFQMFSCRSPLSHVEDMNAYANSRKDDLKLSVYITAQAVDRLLTFEAGRREAISVLKANGITKAYVEVYRSGLAISPDVLQSVSDFLKKNGFEVAGGIATVPGDDIGVKQAGRLGWFNWQNKKTQEDLKGVIEQSAPVFDEFIIDDFLCTADTSLESITARGDQSWSQYRRDLMVRLSRELFIEPAQKVNPDIQMIIKYPQWYDRYHLFGYDVARQPKIFDKVWIGTESRGQYTPGFGYVQPYESFVNYCWMASLSGEKMGGAWFDHIDCTGEDFIDQSYQSVLGGAKELILFNYFNFTEGHPGEHLLRMQLGYLADLAKTIDKSPVYGIPAYKPPNSDAGGDLYIYDYIGMLGIPLLPVSEYPGNEPVLFLPAQAAEDTLIFQKIKQSLNKGSRIIMTTGFLKYCRNAESLADLAGIKWPVNGSSTNSKILVDGKKTVSIERGIDLESVFEIADANMLLKVLIDNREVPYLSMNKERNIVILNSHTFSQTDFENMGELLLCPRPLGILDINENWANTIRNAFIEQLSFRMDAPPRVTFQPFGNHDFMIQNYNKEEVKVILTLPAENSYTDVFSGINYKPGNSRIQLVMPARSRIWLIPGEK